MKSEVINKFSTEVYSLQKLGASRYLIPTYQRPYVWKVEQVSKLVDDFEGAFKRNDVHYFIGTIMTSFQNGKEELIDGQQRFTTLWLIAVAFKSLGIKSKITRFLKADSELRFDFAIRVRLREYLTLLMQNYDKALKQYPETEIKADEYLVHIAEAITTIKSKLNIYEFDDEYSREAFGDYIYEKVCFVKNTTPDGINLNKLFTTINNSGIQLEQTDILKANLLKQIKSEKIIYSKIWEACENMENYFERNVRKLFPATQWETIKLHDFKKCNKNKFLYKDEENVPDNIKPRNSYLLSSILNGEGEDQTNVIQPLKIDYEGKNKTDEVVYCESIITFGQLLIHAYRIFLYENNKPDFELPFHVNNLLKIFNDLLKEDEEQIKNFIACLWKVRYAFDLHVVKWLSNPGEKEKILTLTTISKDNNKNTFSRSPKEKDNLTMLQSVLYFTSNYNTQIWLTPFLNRLINGESKTALKCLESIDNELSLSTEQDKETTYKLMYNGAVIRKKENITYYLNSALGTSFKHYWFQKLEYILWKNWRNKTDRQFQNYRITSKNSVEHVFPQHHEFGKTIDVDILDSFGNLALLNVSQNSSYSNQDVKKKRVDFENKQVYDSLKLYQIYRNF